MTKDGEAGEAGQVGGADWLLSQLRGDRAAAPPRAADPTVASEPDHADAGADTAADADAVSSSDPVPFWRRKPGPAVEQAPTAPDDAEPTAADSASPTPAQPTPAQPTPAKPAAERIAPARAGSDSVADSADDDDAAPQAPGGFQWALTPSDEPDPVIAAGRVPAATVAEGVAAAAAATTMVPPVETLAPRGDTGDATLEERFAPQLTEPFETVEVAIDPSDLVPAPRPASAAVNSGRAIEDETPEPAALIEPEGTTAAESLDLPDALADAMALPDGVPGAAAFGRPPSVPYGSGAGDAIDWMSLDEDEEPLDVAAPAPVEAVPVKPVPVAPELAPVAAVPVNAIPLVVPAEPPQVAADSGGDPPVSPPPGAGVPRPVLWVAGAVLMVLVLVGLFFLGTRLGGGVPIAAPSAAPSPTEEASTEAPVAVLPDGTQPAGEYGWNELGGGECIAPFTSAWDERFTVVDCAEPHAAQLVLRSNYGDNADVPFPGEETLSAQIPAACTAPGVIDLAAAEPFGDVQVQGSFPVSEEQWTSGTAAYFCFVSRSSAEPLTGSLMPPA